MKTNRVIQALGKRSLKEYLSSNSSLVGFQECLKYVSPCAFLVVGGKKVKAKVDELSDLSFGEVLLLRNADFTKYEELLQAFEGLFSLKRADVLKASVGSVHGAMRWIDRSLGELIELEEKELGSSSQERASRGLMKKLSRHGFFALIDTLAMGDVTCYEKIEKMPYRVIFQKMVLSKDRSDFELQYYKK